MKSLDIFTQHPTITQQNILVDICKPLKKLNITYFAHVHIDHKNQMSTIGLEPKFFNEYFKNKFQEYDLHQADFINNYILWDLIKVVPNSYTKKMQEVFSELGYGHTFSIVKNVNGCRDYYHFSTKYGNDFMNNNYLHIIHELHAFINYFTDQVQQHRELKNAYQIKFSLKGDGGFLAESPWNIEYLKDVYKEFLTKRFYINHKEYLTNKELECLHWVAKGKVEEEIAIILQISRRTVKEHIKNIKSKLQCRTLFQLGMMYTKVVDHIKV